MNIYISNMIQVVVIFFLFFQYGSMEPPVGTYLPSSRSSSSSNNFAPPAANVSFNFGYSSKLKKNNLSGYSVQDSYDQPITKNFEQYGRNKEMSENEISRNNMNNHPYHSETSNNQDHDSKYNNIMKSSLPSSTPLPYHSQYDSSYQEYLGASKSTPSQTYGPQGTNTLPIIEDNLFRNSAQNRQSYQPQSKTNSVNSSPRNSQGYEYSSRSSAKDGLSEPTTYDFSYDVMAPESGVSLGHHENFDGESAEGVYHNLLPDGRLLTVEYTADDGGFKPRISYKILNRSNGETSGPY